MSEKPRLTRKELKAEIAELRDEVGRLRAEIRNRPPVFTVNRRKVEGCAVYVTGVDVQRDAIPYASSAGFVQHLPGPCSMSLMASGPFPRVGMGEYWLIPKEANP